MSTDLFHVVLHTPRIPLNAGSVGRTCAATGCVLHLVRPLGFSTSAAAYRRAGLDYWPRVSVVEHADWPTYLRATPGATRWLIENTPAAPGRTPWDATIRRGDHLIFGNEVAGLPGDIVTAFSDRLLTLPMRPGERSLNLSNAVCAVVYEGMRQCSCRERAG